MKKYKKTFIVFSILIFLLFFLGGSMAMKYSLEAEGDIFGRSELLFSIGVSGLFTLMFVGGAYFLLRFILLPYAEISAVEIKSRDKVGGWNIQSSVQPAMQSKFGFLALAAPFVAGGLVIYLGSFLPDGRLWTIGVFSVAALTLGWLWHKLIMKNPLQNEGLFEKSKPYLAYGLVILLGLLFLPDNEVSMIWTVGIAFVVYSKVWERLVKKIRTRDNGSNRENSSE